MRTLTTILLCSLVLVGSSACDRGDSDASDNNENQPVAKQQKTWAPQPPRAVDQKPVESSVDALPMRTGVRVVIRTIVRGLPIADKPFIDVKSWQLGPAELAYTVPDVATGSVTVPEAARTNGNAFMAPMYWGSQANRETQGPMIWLSADTFKALHDTGATTIAPGALPGAGPAPGAPIALNKTGEGTFTLLVESRRLDVPVLLATDASGTQYKILNSLDDPLVLSLRYAPGSQVGGAPRTGPLLDFDGFDVYAIEPTPAAVDADKKPVQSLRRPGAGTAMPATTQPSDPKTAQPKAPK